MPIIVGLWLFKSDLTRAKERIAAASTVHVTASLHTALEELHQLAQGTLLNQNRDLSVATPMAIANGSSASGR